MLAGLKSIFAMILEFIFNYVKNPGISIILISIFVQLLILPLTRKQMESTQKMNKINPEIKKIQEKYKKDPEKQNAEMQKLFKERGYSPFSGCLPLIIQFPIMIGMFELLRDQELVQSIMGQNMQFLFWDLTVPDPVYVLPVLAAALTFFHQRLSMQKQQNQQMKMMMYIFPVMILFFSVKFPTGLVIYWIINSLAMITSNVLLNRHAGEEEEGVGKS